VASDLLGAYTDGVWLVELASLQDPSFVLRALAGVLGVREERGRPLATTLIDHLRPKDLLLVLDNCEHLVATCAATSDSLLRACPNLRILATSREALGIAGETAWRVPSLSLPDLGRLGGASDPMQYEALRLFVHRAAEAQPAFALTDRNAPAVARICYHLDGIPLAIELAAARAKTLSVDQILARLGDRFQLLTGGSRTALPRHQTLKATMDWSHDLLSEAERMLFRRLSVFSGGFTLQAVEAVCADGIDSDEILDLLTRLVDKSLVVVEEKGGGMRYNLLETVRQYGLEKLLEAKEESVLRDRHLGWFLALAENSERELRGPDQATWMGFLDVEHDNLRAALGWSQRSGEVEEGLRLAGALWRFWYVRDYLKEGSQWLKRALSRGKGASASARAKALHAAGYMAWRQEDHSQATALFEEGLTLFRERGDGWGIAESLRCLGFVARDQGDYTRATALFEESLALFREIGEGQDIAWPLNDLGVVALNQGDYPRAEAFCNESLSLFREIGDEWGSAVSLNILAIAAGHRGNYDVATELFEESLALFGKFGDKHGVAWCLKGLAEVAGSRGPPERAEALYKESLFLYQELGHKSDVAGCLEGLGGVAASTGQPERGARLLGAAQALRKAIGVPLAPSDRADYDRNIASLRAVLGGEAFAVAWEEGQRMTPEEALAWRGKEEAAAAHPPAAPAGPYPAGLTAREVDVLRLVAMGLTNAQAAERLSLSERTVRAHLYSIYRKIGASSRTAATLYAIGHKLI
jgi:non-specific serine/threonine protein kinase